MASLSPEKRAVFVVSSTADAGANTLRDAIIAANGAPGPDTIVFTTGPATITLLSNLPIITGPGTQIHGETGPITLANGGIAGAAVALEVDASNCVIRGLTIDGFDVGVQLSSAGGSTTGNQIGQPSAGLGNVIIGCDYGIYVLGTACDGNFVYNNRLDHSVTSGITCQDGADNNQIGGLNALEPNIVTRSDWDGIQITALNAPCDGNQVLGNYIGTNPMGSSGLGNLGRGVHVNGPTTTNTLVQGNMIVDSGRHGVEIDQAIQTTVTGNQIGFDATPTARPNLSGVAIHNGAILNTIGPGNVISGNTEHGIRIWIPGSIDNLITGNIVGLDPTGATDLGNGFDGIEVNTAPNRVENNVVSGNDENGIEVLDATTPTSVEIVGNYVGTDVTGGNGVGNTLNGISLVNVCSNHIVYDNVVSDNGQSGIYIQDTCSAIFVRGNMVGTKSSGTGNLGNTSDGIKIEGTGVLVGGPLGSGEGNIIAYNGGHGVSLGSPTFTGGTGNALHGNDIFSNVLDGILFGYGADDNLVGEEYRVASDLGNSIYDNGGHGIQVGPLGLGVLSEGNRILSNSIHDNGGYAIEQDEATPPGNKDIPSPTIFGALPVQVWGTTNLGNLDTVVQIFVTDNDEADSLVAEFDVIAGHFFNVPVTLPVGATITATNTATFPTTSDPVHTSDVSGPFSLSGGGSVVAYDGLVTESAGSATLSISGGHLIVENIGSSGQDGVIIHTPGAAGGGAEWSSVPDPIDLTDGSQLEFEARDEDGALLCSAAVTDMGSHAQITPDFSPLGASTYTVEVYTSGLLQATFPNQTGPFGMLDALPTSVDVRTNLTHAAGEDPVIEVALGLPPGTSIMAGKKKQIIDGLVFLTGTATMPETIGTVELGAAMAPGPVDIEIVKLCLFTHQREFSGLGGAIIDVLPPDYAPQKAFAWSQSKLHVSNIGSSGQDGVAIPLEYPETAVHVDFQAAALSTDTSLQLEAMGTIGGMPDQPLGSTYVTGSTTKRYTLCFIWDNKFYGSPTSRIDLYLADSMVGTTSGVSADLVAESDAPPSTVGFSRSGMAKWKWEMPTLITVMGGTPTLANELRIVPESPAYTPDSQDAVCLTATDVPDGHLAVHVRNEILKPDGDTARSLGEASMAILGPPMAPSNALWLGNIGSSGEDGVELESPDSDQYSVRYALPPAAADGSMMEVICNGVPSTWAIQSARNAGLIDLSVDGSGFGSSTMTVQAYDDGVMVAEFSGVPNGMLGTLSDWTIGAGFEADGVGTAAWLELPAGAVFTSSFVAATGKGSILADVLRFVAESPSSVPFQVGGAHLYVQDVSGLLITSSGSGGPTNGPSTPLPLSFGLHDPKPNPFNPQTTLSFDLERQGRALLVVYDLSGRVVRRLMDEVVPAGRHELLWDGTDDRGRQVSSGVYLVRLVATDQSESRKMTLVK